MVISTGIAGVTMSNLPHSGACALGDAVCAFNGLRSGLTVGAMAQRRWMPVCDNGDLMALPLNLQWLAGDQDLALATGEDLTLFRHR
jgi:hypothetical protein